MIWIQTFGGHKFDFDDLTNNTIKITDIAHHLALVCRFTGACKHHYSVAQHSILVAQLCPKKARIHGLMHDAAEAYLGDVSRPLKKWGLEVKGFEEKVLQSIYHALNLEWPEEYVQQAVKDSDNIALSIEAKQLMNHATESWSYMSKEMPNISIDRWSPERAEVEFLRKWFDYNEQGKTLEN